MSNNDNKINNNYLFDNEMNISNNSTNLLIKNNNDLFHNQLFNFGNKKKKVFHLEKTKIYQTKIIIF